MFKRSMFLFLILTIALFMVIGCDKDEGTKPTPINEFNLVAAVGDNYFSDYSGVNIPIVDVFDLLIDNNDSNDPFIIDYRSAADFASGHITGAINMAIGDLVTNITNNTIPSDETILNVCYSGQTASVATAVLNMIGYDAQNLLFGMCSVDITISNTGQWTGQIAADEHAGDLTADGSTTTTTHTFPTLSTGKSTANDIIKDRFNEVIAAGWPKILANDVWDNLDDYFIINYWPTNHYAVPGHIPGAYQFTPNESLEKDEKLNLLPTDKTIVVYCYTGQTSAQVATYLTILGYDAKSLLYGTNGFAYNATGYTSGRYTPPAAGTYDAILTK